MSLKILIFLLMCASAILVIIKGFLKYINSNGKTSIMVTTSVVVAIINIVGSVLCVYIDKILP